MAVLNREQFFDRLNEMFAERNDDEAIAFIEDMTDTYNTLEANGSSTDWEERYKKLDESWKEKYKRRFFSGVPNIVNNEADPLEEEKGTAESITFEDLFSEENKKTDDKNGGN